MVILNYIKKAFKFPIENISILFFYFIIYSFQNFFNNPLAAKWNIKQQMYIIHPLFFAIIFLIIPNIIILSGTLGLVRGKLKNSVIKWVNFLKYCIQNLYNGIGVFVIILTLIFVTGPLFSIFGRYRDNIAILEASFIHTLFYALWSLTSLKEKGIYCLKHNNFFHRMKFYRLDILIVFSLSLSVRIISQVYGEMFF